MIEEADAALPSSQSQPTLPSKRKKKRKKSGSNNFPSDDGDNGDCKTIFQSKISLKKQLSLKNTCKQTPWYDTNELIDTGRALLLSLKLFPSNHSQQHHQYINTSSFTPEGLTPDEHTQLQLALRRVAVWRGRSARGGRLSHAVDITAGFAGLLLCDAERMSMSHHANTTNATTSPYQLRNSYSTLLLRSVNGLADTYRHQKKSATLSVSHCCALAGLPLWIVDIRHDASHNDLPSLGLCRIGAIESLRFWKTRYWDTLESKVWGMRSEIGTNNIKNDGSNIATGESDTARSEEVGICTHALDCLVRYQNADLLEASEREASSRNHEGKIAKPQLKQDNAQNIAAGSETEDLLRLPDEPKKENKQSDTSIHDTRETVHNNPFAILHEEKPKKKKSKKNIEQNNCTTRDNVNISSGRSIQQNDVVKSVTNTSPQPSSRDCAAEFVRDVPIDIAISTALRFLVWGVNQGPALLTGQTELSLTQDVDTTFDKLRAIYDPLIIAVTNAYPGFFSALFVHLIDSILCLDSERGSEDERSRTDATLAKEGENCVELIACNIRYLEMWFRYILSREFHMHFSRSAAIYVEEAKSVLLTSQTSGEQREIQSQPIDLKKKGKKKWTQLQLKFMQSHLHYTTFQGLGVPMNSVCDRLLSHQNQYGRNIDSIVNKLLHLIEGILGENRVEFMGLIEQRQTTDGTKDETCCPAANVEQDSEPIEAGKSATATATEDASTPKDMSLEDMEAFLSSAATSEDKNAGRENQLDVNIDNTDQLVVSEPTNDALHVPVADIKPWTLCKSWDACAIGAMPGYPA